MAVLKETRKRLRFFVQIIERSINTKIRKEWHSSPGGRETVP